MGPRIVVVGCQLGVAAKVQGTEGRQHHGFESLEVDGLSHRGTAGTVLSTHQDTGALESSGIPGPLVWITQHQLSWVGAGAWLELAVGEPDLAITTRSCTKFWCHSARLNS